jgi:hypothetical protein
MAHSIALIGHNIGMSLIAEGAHDHVRLQSLAVRAFVQAIGLRVPAVLRLIVATPYILRLFGPGLRDREQHAAPSAAAREPRPGARRPGRRWLWLIALCTLAGALLAVAGEVVAALQGGAAALAPPMPSGQAAPGSFCWRR